MLRNHLSWSIHPILTRLLLYDAVNDKVESLPVLQRSFADFVVYDEDNHKYYAFRGRRVAETNYIEIMDAGNLSVEPVVYKDEISTGYVGISPVGVFANGLVHIIGGSASYRHFVFDINTKKFQDKHVFHEWVACNSSAAVVCVSSMNEIYLLGGFDHHHEGGGWLDEIWKYSCTDDQWQKLTVKLPFKGCDFACLLTNNEKYVVVSRAKQLYYWKVGTDEFLQSKVKMDGQSLYRQIWRIHHMVTTGDRSNEKVLVHGFVAQICREYKIEHCPQDVMQILIAWCVNSEYIHALYCDGETSHWKIEIERVIPN